jgi:uncharacterized protein
VNSTTRIVHTAPKIRSSLRSSGSQVSVSHLDASSVVSPKPSPFVLTLRQIALLYTLAIIVAELVTTFIHPLTGTLIHGAIFATGIVHGATDTRHRAGNLWMSLSLVPLIRLVSFGLPLGVFPQEWWYVLTAIPLMTAALTAMHTLELSRKDVGLVLPRPGSWSLTIVVGLSGLFIGLGEYVLLGPSLLFDDESARRLLLAVTILFIGTGVVEELIFRGVLQATAAKALRFWPGIAVVSMLFAVMHIGHGSVLNVGYIFLVAMYLGVARRQTGSLLGVTIAHTLANFVLLIAMTEG